LIIKTVIIYIVFTQRALKYRIYFDFAPLRSLRRPLERPEYVREGGTKNEVENIFEVL